MAKSPTSLRSRGSNRSLLLATDPSTTRFLSGVEGQGTATAYGQLTNKLIFDFAHSLFHLLLKGGSVCV